MNPELEPLRSSHRRAYVLGLALCLGTPSLLAALFLSGALPPGQQAPEGIFQQLGYLFTGVVFLSGAWGWNRRARVLRGFGALPRDRRPALILRETLSFALLCELSSLCGLVYWMLMGAQAARHAWGFLLLSPLLFAALVPRFDHWARSLEG